MPPKYYHFQGFISLMPGQHHDIKTNITAYSEKQAYLKLSFDLAPKLNMNSKQLYSLLRNSRSLKVRL